MPISCVRTTELWKAADYNIDGSGELTIDNLSAYLKNKSINVRYNTITRELEITGFIGESVLQIRENAPTLIYDDLHRNLKRCTENRIAAFLNVIASRNEYNPVLDMLSKVKWDGTDRIAEIYRIFGISDDFSKVLVRKWLMQAVAGLHNSLKAPFSLDMCLVFAGRQGVGKTRFFEHLCSFAPDLFSEGAAVDPQNKDNVIQFTSSWICELGEIGATLKKDIDRLKAFLSLAKDRYRVPFGRSVLSYPRHTVFVGTVNDSRFLIDETGNRRFLTVQLDDDLKIDFSSISEFDSKQLWAQVNCIVEDAVSNGETYASCFRLTHDEQQVLANVNAGHEKPLPGQEEVEDIIHSALNPRAGYKTEWKPMTVSDFIAMHYPLGKYNVRQVGKVLEKLGYSQITVRDETGPRKKRYLPVEMHI